MRPKKYLVDLSLGERQTLEKLTTGKHAAYQINHARILLKADVNQPKGGWSDEAISAALDLGTATLERVRRRFVGELDELEPFVARKKTKSGCGVR